MIEVYHNFRYVVETGKFCFLTRVKGEEAEEELSEKEALALVSRVRKQYDDFVSAFEQSELEEASVELPTGCTVVLGRGQFRWLVEYLEKVRDSYLRYKRSRARLN